MQETKTIRQADNQFNQLNVILHAHIKNECEIDEDPFFMTLSIKMKDNKKWKNDAPTDLECAGVRLVSSESLEMQSGWSNGSISGATPEGV